MEIGPAQGPSITESSLSTLSVSHPSTTAMVKVESGHWKDWEVSIQTLEGVSLRTFHSMPACSAFS